MKLLRSLSLFLLSYTVTVSASTFEVCGNKSISVKYLEVIPDPVKLHEPFQITATVVVSDEITSDVIVEVSIKKHVKVIKEWLMEVPCLAGHGSCIYKPCEILPENKKLCIYFPKDVPCVCPIQPATYSGTATFTIDPNSSPIFNLMAEGQYQMELKAKDPFSNTELGCVIIFFGIQNPSQATSLHP